VWAALAVGLAALSSLVIGLAVNAVPKSWGWAHNWWVLSGIGACLSVIAALVAVLQVHSSPDSKDETKSSINFTRADRSSVAGSNSGTMISTEAVYIGTIGTIGTADASGNSPMPEATHSKVGIGESPRSSPPLQHQGASGHETPKDTAKDDSQTRGGLVLRASKISKNGESINIEIFNTATAKQWILNDPWGHAGALGAADDE
jgi:hypothetical protein